MSAIWADWQGYNPEAYAQKALRACGLLEPPFCEMTIADLLGIKVYQVTAEDMKLFRQMYPTHSQVEPFIQESSTFLVNGEDGRKTIFTPEGASVGRRRMNIFHECGHSVVPWHRQYCYICKDKDMDPLVRKQIEREAFHCGAEFMMPRSFFIKDALDIGMGIAAIQLLSKRYHASLEATANWFAHIHPGICSILIIEPVDTLPTMTVEQHIPTWQRLLPVGMPYASLKSHAPMLCPLKVKYCIRSKRFPDYIAPGTGINEGTPIHEAWLKKKMQRGEVPASTFGFLEKPDYQFECLPLGYRDRVMVLLWTPDPQIKMEYYGGPVS